MTLSYMDNMIGQEKKKKKEQIKGAGSSYHD